MTTYVVNGGSVDELYKKFEAQSSVKVNAKGNAECALLVQELTGAPITTAWKRGTLVKGGNVVTGTAIATFKTDGTYDGKSGVCHAAIFIKETADGLEVWDQWRNGHVGKRKDEGYFHGKRVCKFKTEAEMKSNNYRPQNDGNAFYVIET